MNGDSDAAQWKQKYFDSLEELEAKENQWKSLETLLRQLVSRLTLAADQSEPDLVKQLDQLRQEIRSNITVAQLQTRFDAINQGILGLDERRKQRQRSTDIASGLSQILDRVELPVSTIESASCSRLRTFCRTVSVVSSGRSASPGFGGRDPKKSAGSPI